MTLVLGIILLILSVLTFNKWSGSNEDVSTSEGIYNLEGSEITLGDLNDKGYGIENEN